MNKQVDTRFDENGEIAQAWTRDELLSIQYTPSQMKAIMGELVRIGRGGSDDRRVSYTYTSNILQNAFGDRSAFTLDDVATYSISDLRSCSNNGLVTEYLPVVLPGAAMVIGREVEGDHVGMLQLFRCVMRNGVELDGDWEVAYDWVTATPHPDSNGMY